MQKEREYIYAVYEEKSFSRAAEKLYVSQPALSAAVKKVETEIGCLLFNRNSNPIQLTPAGKYYISSLEKIFQIEKEMKEYFEHLSAESEGHIRIGAASYFCIYVLPPLVTRFQQEFFGYDINIIEISVEHLTNYLQSDIIDLCISVERIDKNLFESHVWNVDRLILAVPAKLPINDALQEWRLSFSDIANDAVSNPDIPAVDLSVFKDEPFLLLRKGNDMYSRSMRICKNAGFVPKVAMQLNQLMTSYFVAQSGRGIAFVRDDIVRHVPPTKDLVFYKINDKNSTRNITLNHKKTAALAPGVKCFVDWFLANSLLDKQKFSPVCDDGGGD